VPCCVPRCAFLRGPGVLALHTCARCGVCCRAESSGRVSDLIASLMEQINQAGAQADAGVADIATQYRDNPLLSAFYIPRFSIADVVVDLKMAVASVSESSADKKTNLINVGWACMWVVVCCVCCGVVCCVVFCRGVGVVGAVGCGVWTVGCALLCVVM
jgi:hypothetical protein